MAVLARETPSATARGRGGLRWLDPRRRARLGRLALHVVLIVLGISFVMPFAWMISTSLKQPGNEFVFPPRWIPNPVEWSNYKTALVDAVPFLTYVKNTVIITVGATALDVLTSAVIAYSFARLRWPGRNVMFVLTLATLMLPNIVTVIPTFLLMRYLHWIDSFLSVITVSWAGGRAFSIFLFRQFFLSIPLELDEAARMDGANPLRVFWSVILPLSGTVVATVTIFDVLNNWNDLFNPLIYLNSESNYTMALGLSQYAVGHYGTLYNLQMAAAVVMTLPVIVLFFFAQRFFLRGIVTTGLAAH